MKNRVNVEIYGRSYPMATDESPEYTERLAATLNQRFEKLRAQKRSISIQDAAAVISLECLDELIKNKQTEHNIRTQISAYAEDASESRAEIEKLNKQLAAYAENSGKSNAEIEKLNNTIGAYAEDAEESRAEIEKLNKELAASRAEVVRLNERIAQLEREIKLRCQFAADESPEQIVGNRTPTAQPAQSAQNVQRAQPAQTAAAARTVQTAAAANSPAAARPAAAQPQTARTVSNTQPAPAARPVQQSQPAQNVRREPIGHSSYTMHTPAQSAPTTDGDK